jgi:hypothetical protein
MNCLQNGTFVGRACSRSHEGNRFTTCAARFFAVAAAFDAITTDGLYRKARTRSDRRR